MGRGRIWMNTKGRILWNAPSDEDAVTFEEQSLPSERSGVEPFVLDLGTPTDTQWWAFYHRLAVEEDSEGFVTFLLQESQHFDDLDFQYRTVKELVNLGQ